MCTFLKPNFDLKLFHLGKALSSSCKFVSKMISNGFSYLLCLMVGFIFGFILLGHPNTISSTKMELVKNKLVEEKRKSFEKGDNDNIKIQDKIIEFQRMEKELSLELHNSTKVLCWIMHSCNRIENRNAIMETWGRRCNFVLFVCGNKSIPLEKSPLITNIAPNAQLAEFNMEDKYDILWLKTKTAFKYIIKNFKSQFDWIYKIDDDSYVVMENLKLFLQSRNQTDKVYFGCQYQTNAPKGYSSGGPGYIMSNYIAEKFVETLSMSQCPQGDGGAEDVNVGNCLALINVYPADTRDTYGRFRFSPFIPEMVIDKKLMPKNWGWFFSFTAHTMKDGLECCSDTAIAYHYTTPSLMRMMEYLVYYLHPFSTRGV